MIVLFLDKFGVEQVITFLLPCLRCAVQDSFSTEISQVIICSSIYNPLVTSHCAVHFLLMKAYQYLREEVKTFQGKPIKVRKSSHCFSKAIEFVLKMSEVQRPEHHILFSMNLEYKV